jgi:membrane protein DedA with SNARE-associated domain
MPDALIQLLGQYGYAILFVLVLLMNAGVPLPGHMAYVASSILAGRGTLSLPLVMAAGFLAAVLGAGGGFILGVRGGRRLLDVYGPRVGLSAKRMSLLDGFFAKHGAKAIFLTRFFVVIRTFGAVFAGVSRVPAPRFALVTSAGAVVWAAAFGAAGYVFGDQWHIVEDWLVRGGLIGFGVVALLAVGHVLWRRRKNRQKEREV